MEPIVPQVPNEEVVVKKENKLSLLRKVNFFCQLIIALVLLIGLPSGFYVLENNRQNEAKKEKIVPTKTLLPTPTALPTSAISSTPAVVSKIPVTSKISPTASPAASTKGTINLTFLEWIPDKGVNATNNAINGVTTDIHVGGSGVDANYKGSPNWSIGLAPGTYNVSSGQVPSGYGSFKFQECGQEECGYNSGNVQNCSFTVKLKAGSNVSFACYYQK